MNSNDVRTSMTTYTAKILQIIDETPDVKTFRVKRPEQYDFLPGQYTMVSIPSHPIFSNKTIPLTMSSSPLETQYIDFTVKLMKEFTHALFNLNIGNDIAFNEPKPSKLAFDESLTEQNTKQKTIVYIAGGSGITPFMSAIRYVVQKKLNTKIILLFGNRTVADIIYKKELEQIQKDNPNIQIVNVLSQENNILQNTNMIAGRIDKEKIQKYVTELNNSIIFLCGPPPMTASVKTTISELNVPEQNIRFDKWELPGKGTIEK